MTRVVVLDTNVIVSAFLNPRGTPGTILEMVGQGRVDLAVTMRLWGEVLRTITSEKIQKILVDQGRRAEVETAVARLSGSVTVVAEVPPSRNWISEDPSDDWVIQCAITAQAECVVSGDRHILAHGELAGIPTRSPRAFVEELRVRP